MNAATHPPPPRPWQRRLHLETTTPRRPPAHKASKSQNPTLPHFSPYCRRPLGSHNSSTTCHPHCDSVRYVPCLPTTCHPHCDSVRYVPCLPKSYPRRLIPLQLLQHHSLVLRQLPRECHDPVHYLLLLPFVLPLLRIRGRG
jgi:hypothetical protein